MDKDFHYYGTFVAARMAGYNHQEAETIAYAAQYVDDHSFDNINKAFLPGLDPIPTVQTLGELIKYGKSEWSEKNLIGTAKAWVPFHFLPGNYGDNPKKIEYRGVLAGSDKSGQYIWNYDEESKEQFKLMCLPNSRLVSEIVNDIINNHKGKDYELYMIGLRMHVIEDTWAHYNFAGIPAWFINEVGKTVINLDTKESVSWPPGESTPPTPSFNSYAYLGHGRIGHLPDYPYMRYSYNPQWAGKGTVEKNNPEDYIKAFKQIVTALRCIREKKNFNVNMVDNIDENTLKIVTEILKRKSKDLCLNWEENINRIKIDNKPLIVPREYDSTLWLKTASTSPDKKKTEYYHFNYAAINHLTLVDNILKSNGIFIGETPKENIVEVNLISKAGAIGKCIVSGYNYPTISETPVRLLIIKPNSKILESEDIVKIKTSEAVPDERNYLGAWADRTGLYYEARDMNISKQKWQIVKVGGSPGSIINSGDIVHLKNIHYKNEPNMSYYKPTFGTINYLTTVDSYTPETFFIIRFEESYGNKIAAGGVNVAAIKKDGTVIVWGDNKYEQCKVPSDLKDVKAVSCHEDHIVALKSNGTVAAWGSNHYEQCNIPKDLKNVKAVSAGCDFTAALKNDGTVTAWGKNNNGQCKVPKDLIDVKAISAGWYHVAALKSDGTVTAWQDNVYRKCTPPKDLRDVKAVAAGYEYTAALKNDDTIEIWGQNASVVSNVPHDLSNIKSIAAGFAHIAALKSDGTVVVWGDNSYGQCDIPPNVKDIVEIATSSASHFIAALKKDGTIITWGSNVAGEGDVPKDLKLF